MSDFEFTDLIWLISGSSDIAGSFHKRFAVGLGWLLGITFLGKGVVFGMLDVGSWLGSLGCLGV